MTPDQLKALKKIKGEDYVPPTDETNAGENGADPIDEKKTGDTSVTAEPNTPAPADQTKPEPQSTVVVPSQDDLDEEKVLAYLKKNNINIASIKELAPKEDPEAIAEKRENEKLSYALGKNLFSKKEYENYISDSKTPDAVVFAEYLKEALDEDPEANEEDIRNEFIDKYGISEETTSRKYKRGVQELALQADKILKARYGKIYDADKTYNQHEQEQMSKREREAFLLSQTPKYKADVDDILSSLKGYKYQLSETEEFPLDFSDENIQSLKTTFLDPAYVEQLVEQKYNKEILTETIFLAALKQNFPKLLRSYAEKVLLEKQAGVKGIVHVHTGTSKEDTISNLNAKQTKALEFLKQRVEKPIAN